jgi:hypothetical protein
MDPIKEKVIEMYALKEAFSHCPVQKVYYDNLNELIELIVKINNYSLLNDFFHEFLWPMCIRDKTEEAEAAQNDILKRYS